MGKSKIIYGGNVLIDLTADTVTSDKLATGYTAHDQTGTLITGTMAAGDASVLCLTKTLSFSTKLTTSRLIWYVSELDGFPLSSFSSYEYLSMMAIKTDSSLHTSNHVTFSNSFYPYTSYRTGSNYVYTGIAQYHGSSSTAVYSKYSTLLLTGNSDGFFKIASDGIYFYATSSYGLYGTYLFSLSAKLTT